jgi:RsiW-degrading membrane proteinase PrsW (M82 family)
VKIQVALTGAIPAIVAMWVVDRLDAKRPEPPKLRRLVAGIGMFSVIPALAIELLLSATLGAQLQPEFTYQGATFKSFVVAAGVEEACKIGVIYWIVWRRPEFDERMDGIVYACRAGLGFALVENVMYLLLVAKTLEDQLQMWLLRAVLSVPGHAMWTGMIGAFAARRRFDKTGPGIVGGYLLAVAFHGAYDVSLFVQQPLHLEDHGAIARVLVVVPIVLTVVAFFVVRGLARTALRLDDAEAARLAVRAAVRLPGARG